MSKPLKATQADLDKIMRDLTLPPGVDARACFDRMCAAIAADMLVSHGVTDLSKLLLVGDLAKANKS